MASVFLSYDRDDSGRARQFARMFEAAGHTVWWDLHVRGGAQFSKVIEEALRAADAVVVLWSKNSVESAWVRDEAAAGRDTGRLVPVTIDGTPPPLGFRQFQTIEFKNCRGTGKSRERQELNDAIRALTDGSLGPSAPPAADVAKTNSAHPKVWMIALPGAAVVAVAAYLLWPSSSPSAPTVTVLAASNDPAAQELSRGLFANLGSLQARDSNALQLVESDEQKRSQLVFKVDASSKSGPRKASLLLLSGSDHRLLWSGDYQQPSNSVSDLQLQLAYGAANVLGCAADAYGGGGRSLDQETRALYLRTCGDLTQVSGVEKGTLVNAFREVVRRAPKFQPGWSRLLEAESEFVFNPPYDRNFPAMIATLQKDILAARQISPELPAAYAAEAQILGQRGRFTDPARLLDRAVQKDPDEPLLLAMHAEEMQKVGRMKAAVNDARRAVEIRPFSPAMQQALISALVYAGEFAAATSELAKAEKSFPGASYLLNARYRLDLRYGSAQTALQQLHSGAVAAYPDQESFLKARIDPTGANVDRAIQAARDWLGSSPAAPGEYIQALAQFARYAELKSFLMRLPANGGGTGVLFRPVMNNFWRDPGSLEVAAHLGLIDYWRESGYWPDFCSLPALPYNCKTEAARAMRTGS